MGATLSPSPALLAANQLLLQRRAAVYGQQQTNSYEDVERETQPTTVPPKVVGLPSHLGWESHAVTALLRVASQKQARQAEDVTAVSNPISPILQSPALTAVNEPIPCKLYPDMALAMLRHGQVNAGRIWLLLRQLDENGSGRLSLDSVQTILTTKTSHWRVCGKRQLRNILKQGENIFWHRDQRRIWIRSVAKAAASLDVTHLKLRPVFVSQAILCSTVGTVKAHFYASFHSSRTDTQPISRETLEQVTGVPQRTQRAYEQLAGIEALHHMAVGEVATPEQVQERAWRQGQAFFLFTDFLGKQGPAGRQYTAWHLPNSYTSCHRPAPKGRMRKTNRQIDLVTRRARGNGYNRLFYENGAKAARAFARDTAVDRYWHEQPKSRPRTRLWSVFPFQQPGQLAK
ncbi:MAG: hypothetical protein H6660_03040 [Ardenticatenaceae bacterium]|nr:hypothetical protein [Ardenticatenaceae bacterium]